MKKNSELISEIIVSKNCENGKELIKPVKKNLEKGFYFESYNITNKEQSKYYNKEQGQYDLLTIPYPLFLNDKEICKTKEIIKKSLKMMLGKLDKNSKVLVVGLGNRHISADSLGTNVAKNINIMFSNDKKPNIMAICPSVMGLTGIETYDIISGVISKVKPTHLILIDSLCAGHSSRLMTSIQISNTGICPGSGIGNKRKCIDKKLAPNIVSIGVPLLIYAETFLSETFDKFNINISRISSIMQKLKNTENNNEFCKFLKDVKSSLHSSFNDEIVSPKDIAEAVEILSSVISSAINEILI